MLHHTLFSRGLAIFGIYLFLAATNFAQTVWIDGTGDWFKATNWSAGVPDENTGAIINNGGTAQIAADAGSVGVRLAMNESDSGTLSLSGFGKLESEIGFGAGSATLVVESGADVTGGRFVMGVNPGSNSFATVTGVGSTWQNLVVCFVGSRGNATLNILAGGLVSASNFSIAESDGSNGTVLVDGMGSTLSQSSVLTVAGNGTGSLTISNGGTVSESDPDFGSAEIGRNPGSMGTATVTGAGSQWLNSAVMVVGNNGGNGVLTIADGGSVTSKRGFIGYSNGGAGTVIVEGSDSSWTNSETLQVGGNGMFGFTASGLLRITTGGTVSASATTVEKTGVLEFGPNANLKSSLSVSGGKLRRAAGSSPGTLTIEDALTLGSNAIYEFALNSSTGLADKLVASGITVNSATFSFADLGSGILAPGTAFVILDNTSSSPINGVFDNLPDNSSFTNNGNSFVVSYAGGANGNSLTLTVVPEPGTWRLLIAGSLVLFPGVRGVLKGKRGRRKLQKLDGRT